jgi:hypothetical protein
VIPKIAFVQLARVIIYILILRHPKFIDWLKGLGGTKSGAAAVRSGVC